MKQYLQYKESGMKWAGKIPEKWGFERLKFLDEVIMGQSPSSEDYNETPNGLPFLQGNADFGIRNPTPNVWCKTTTKTASAEDVLVSVRAPIGAINIADQEYGIGRGLCAIRAKSSNKKYLYYLFLCLNDELNSWGLGSTYTAISTDTLRNIKIPVPTIEEQKQIGYFLDAQTKKIDQLIGKRKTMIALIKEERAAVINQAVIKGINPKSKMKDSRIKYLGEIPQQWGIKKLKQVCYLKRKDRLARVKTKRIYGRRAIFDHWNEFQRGSN